MRSLLSIPVVLFTASRVLAQTTFQINTPANVVVCQPALLTWNGGQSPYFLSVLPGASPNGQALEDLGEQQGNSYTWFVNIAAGTSIGLTIRDSSGATAQTAAFTINSGSNSSCVGQPLSSGGSAPATSGVSGSSGTALATSAVSGSSATHPATTPATTGSGGTTTRATTGAATGTSTGTGSSASSTSTKSAASANSAMFGTAGIIGAALVALLV